MHMDITLTKYSSNSETIKSKMEFIIQGLQGLRLTQQTVQDSVDKLEEIERSKPNYLPSQAMLILMIIHSEQTKQNLSVAWGTDS